MSPSTGASRCGRLPHVLSFFVVRRTSPIRHRLDRLLDLLLAGDDDALVATPSHLGDTTPKCSRACIEGQMFGSALYDPEAPWRLEQATEAQYRHLTALDLNAPQGLTKGEASDMISAAIEPDANEVEFLKFFGVILPPLATQLDAKRRIVDIVRDPANKLAWDARPATPEQKEIIRSVDGTVPRGITSAAADKLIKKLLGRRGDEPSLRDGSRRGR